MEKEKTSSPMVMLLVIIKKKVVPFHRGPLVITLCLGCELRFMSQLSTHRLYGQKWFLIQTQCAHHCLFFQFCLFSKRILLSFPAGHNL